jgi:hypothetical protein
LFKIELKNHKIKGEKMDLEKMIAEKLASQTASTNKNKVGVDDFAKFVILDDEDVVRVNQLDIFKDKDDDYLIVIKNLEQLFGLIGWKMQRKGEINKPKAKAIDFSKLLK